MNELVIIILVSIITSFIISFSMVKWHIRMFNKWMEKFFDEETKQIKNYFELVIIILVSIITSFIISFSMVKWHIRMFNKWMEKFFDEETKQIKNYLSRDK